VIRVVLGYREPVAKLEFKVSRVRLAFRGFKAIKEILGSKGRQEFRVSKVRLASKDLPDHKVRLASKEILVP
jgi:hypothetical protein